MGQAAGEEEAGCSGRRAPAGAAAHLDCGVAGGVTDPDRTSAHRRRDVGAVEAGHGFGLFFALKLKVRLPETIRYHGNNWEKKPD